LIIDCTEEGVVFVEAEANCMMEDLGDMTKPKNIEILRKLVYDIPNAKNLLEIPPLLIQVPVMNCVCALNL
jgi:omega-hydroxypalmitate O-feruloyl transferase